MKTEPVQGPSNNRNSSDQASLLALRAIACLDLGDHLEAEALFRASLELKSDDIAACARGRANIATFFFDHGHHERACAFLEEALVIEETSIDESHPDYFRTVDRLAFSTMRMGEYVRSKRLYEKVVARMRQEQAGGADLASRLAYLGWCCSESSQYSEAVEYYEEAKAIYAGIPAETASYRRDLQNLTVAYQRMEKHREARRSAREMLRAIRAAVGKGHRDYAQALECLACVYAALQNRLRARTLRQHAVSILKKTVGEQDPEYATMLSQLAHTCFHLAEYGRAESLYREVLSIRRNALGPRHSATISTLRDIARVSLCQGKYREAAALFGRAAMLRKRLSGESHPEYAVCLRGRAASFRLLSWCHRAAPLIEKAFSLQQATVGRDDVEYAVTAIELAYLSGQLGKWERAVDLFEQALSVLRAGESGGEKEHRVSALGGLSKAYRRLRRFEDAERVLREALDCEIAPPARALVLADLAWVYSDSDRHAEAERYWGEALETLASCVGRRDPQYASVLGDSGFGDIRGGDYARAEKTLQATIALEEEIGVRETWNHISSLGMISRLYGITGQYEKAEAAWRTALEIIRTLRGEQSSECASVLVSLGALRCWAEDWGEACKCFEETARIRELVLEKDDPRRIESLIGLAVVGLAAGDMGGALGLHREALACAEKSGGEKSRYYAAALDCLALQYLEMGMSAEAEPLCQKALGLHEELIGHGSVGYLDSVREFADYSKTRNRLFLSLQIYTRLRRLARAGW